MKGLLFYIHTLRLRHGKEEESKVFLLLARERADAREEIAGAKTQRTLWRLSIIVIIIHRVRERRRDKMHFVKAA
jgi:hypothetical protein